jgi:hypothetical protein
MALDKKSKEHRKKTSANDVCIYDMESPSLLEGFFDSKLPDF